MSACKIESAIEFKRRRGVQLIEEGLCTSVIAHVLDVTKQSLYLWRRRFRKQGNLKFKPRSGRPRKLSTAQTEALRKLLSQGATAHGWPNDLWTSDRVAVVIRKHFNVTCSHNQAWVEVTRYLGWTSQRPVLRSVERNEPLINRWKAEEFPRILRKSTKDARTLFSWTNLDFCSHHRFVGHLRLADNHRLLKFLTLMAAFP